MRGGHRILPRYSAAVLWPRSTISILYMKRMLSKMDRSPTLEDRNSNVRFGSKQTYAAHKHMSALPPKRTCAVQLVMSALGQQRTSGRPQTNTATRGRITLISVNSPGCVLLRYSGLGPLLETGSTVS